MGLVGQKFKTIRSYKSSSRLAWARDLVSGGSQGIASSEQCERDGGKGLPDSWRDCDVVLTMRELYGNSGTETSVLHRGQVYV